MSEYLILTIVFGMFLMSLIGAYVLFKLLKSTAVIKRADYQAGGALAGFILIYGILFYSYDKMTESTTEKERTPWTISGTVKRESTNKHDGVSIRYVPPAPNTYTDASGFFRLENVRNVGNDEYPEIYIENDGYFPISFQIDDTLAVIDKSKQTIRIKNDLTLFKVIE